jgi:hypothetical protein
MPYTTPTTAAGQVLTSAIWNASVRDNLIYLQDRVDNPPRALAFHSTTQSIASGSDTVVVFNSEVVDSGGVHSTSANTGRLTVPTGQDGVWLLTAHVEFAANVTGQRRIFLRHNGLTDLGGLTVLAADAGTTKVSTALLVYLAAADYVEVVALQTSGGALNLSAAPRFGGQRVA